uniref:Uncharacterized protein n=1 Tax=Caenorhabditis japonica TaxID=281687 RepID=A0A8R1EUD6_CAEJA
MRPSGATSGTAAEELAYSRQNEHGPLSEGIVQLGAAWFAVSRMETEVEPHKYHKNSNDSERGPVICRYKKLCIAGRVLQEGSYQTATWQLFGSYLAAIWRLFGGYLAAIWQLSSRYVSAIDLSGIELPGVELPGIELPGIELPGIELPGIELPGIELPGIELPGVERPGIELPGIELPGIELPGIELPGIERPGTEPALYRYSSFNRRLIGD